jgi:hypothetical protein
MCLWVQFEVRDYLGIEWGRFNEFMTNPTRLTFKIVKLGPFVRLCALGS